MPVPTCRVCDAPATTGWRPRRRRLTVLLCAEHAAYVRDVLIAEREARRAPALPFDLQAEDTASLLVDEKSEGWEEDVLERLERARLPARVRFILSARDARLPMGEIAERLGVSRYALYRELTRIEGTYLAPARRCSRPGCSNRLPLTATSRRRYCSDRCRVQVHRLRRGGQASSNEAGAPPPAHAPTPSPRPVG
jgi:hypothetical protein